MSKKMIAVGLAAGLIAGAMVMPAEAAKKKKKAAPVPTTMFMDGTSTFGEEDQIGNATYLKLAPAAGGGEKSVGVPNYVGGPNSNCAGNALVPVFTGPVTGQIVGDMKVTFNAQSSPGQVEIRVWPDLSAQACNESYVEPAGSVIADMPSGEGTVEATIEDLNFTPTASIMIQITPVVAPPPSYGRVFYGTDASKIEFSCVPTSGTTCVSG